VVLAVAFVASVVLVVDFVVRPPMDSAFAVLGVFARPTVANYLSRVCARMGPC